MRIERARRWLSLAASVGSRNWPFLFFVAPATRQNRTRDEEQSRLRRKSLQLSCSVCISFWGANKHSCLNKVVGTMPGPIGWAEGIGVGGIALHIQFASLFLSARCCCLAVYLSSAPPTLFPTNSPALYKRLVQWVSPHTKRSFSSAM